MLDSQSFVVGFIIGFLFALFIGNFAGRIRKNRVASTKSGKKVSVAVSGSDSPREIVGKAAGAGARMTIWFLIVVAISVLTIYGLFRVWSLSPAQPYRVPTGKHEGSSSIIVFEGTSTVSRFPECEEWLTTGAHSSRLSLFTRT